MIRNTLHTQRLLLRRPEAGDLPAYTAYCASDRSNYVGGPFSAPQAFDKFAAMIGHWTLRGFGRYIISFDGAPIGHVGPLARDDQEAPELTWSLWTADAERRGFATEAARAVKKHLISELKWGEMIIPILPDNTASRRVADRVGAILTDEVATGFYDGCFIYRLYAPVPA